MRIVYLTHSLSSCWNHGNAHFLRGVLSDLQARGHDVAVFEPEGAWSLQNLLADHGDAGLDAYRIRYPELRSTTYAPDGDLAPLVEERLARPDAQGRLALPPAAAALLLVTATRGMVVMERVYRDAAQLRAVGGDVVRLLLRPA